MCNVDIEALKEFIILKCNEVLNVDISDSGLWSVPVFTVATGITAWGLLHIIDEMNVHYGFLYNPSDIVDNSRFSLNDFVKSLHCQLLKEIHSK